MQSQQFHLWSYTFYFCPQFCSYCAAIQNGLRKCWKIVMQLNKILPEYLEWVWMLHSQPNSLWFGAKGLCFTVECLALNSKATTWQLFPSSPRWQCHTAFGWEHNRTDSWVTSNNTVLLLMVLTTHWIQCRKDARLRHFDAMGYQLLKLNQWPQDLLWVMETITHLFNCGHASWHRGKVEMSGQRPPVLCTDLCAETNRIFLVLVFIGSSEF